MAMEKGCGPRDALKGTPNELTVTTRLVLASPISVISFSTPLSTGSDIRRPPWLSPHRSQARQSFRLPRASRVLCLELAPHFAPLDKCVDSVYALKRNLAKRIRISACTRRVVIVLRHEFREDSDEKERVKIRQLTDNICRQMSVTQRTILNHGNRMHDDGGISCLAVCEPTHHMPLDDNRRKDCLLGFQLLLA